MHHVLHTCRRRTVPVCLSGTEADVLVVPCRRPDNALADPSAWGSFSQWKWPCILEMGVMDRVCSMASLDSALGVTRKISKGDSQAGLRWTKMVRCLAVCIACWYSDGIPWTLAFYLLDSEVATPGRLRALCGRLKWLRERGRSFLHVLDRVPSDAWRLLHILNLGDDAGGNLW